MNIYKVSQSINDGYDTYDSFVVASNTADEAKYTNPSDDVFWNDGGGCEKILTMGILRIMIHLHGVILIM